MISVNSFSQGATSTLPTSLVGHIGHKLSSEFFVDHALGDDLNNGSFSKHFLLLHINPGVANPPSDCLR